MTFEKVTQEKKKKKISTNHSPNMAHYPYFPESFTVTFIHRQGCVG